MTRIYTEQELEGEVFKLVSPQVVHTVRSVELTKALMTLIKAATRLRGERELPISDRIPKHPNEWMAYHEGQNSLLAPDSEGRSFQPCVKWTRNTPLSVEETTARVEANPALMESLKKGQVQAYSTQQIEPPYSEPC